MPPAREFPDTLRALRDLALDLYWAWSHDAEALWQRIDARAWRRTHNPWAILDDLTQERLTALAAEASFVADLNRLADARRRYLDAPGWCSAADRSGKLGGVAYFSMEFGLGDALPIYAGGLGILAGDMLKAASDLGVPLLGVGLLYEEGYFRQMVDAAGWQQEAYPFNDPASMPIEPVRNEGGGWLHIPVELPGRTLRLRAWRATVGRSKLYLLNTNDPLNSPVDRGITGKLYGGGSEIRLMQEIVLGVGGWRLVQALHPEVEVCHLNEGHAAFAMLERAHQFGKRHGLSWNEALWATRAGNVFTTHTPVKAGFDHYKIDVLEPYARAWAEPRDLLEILPLGREDSDDTINLAHLASRGARQCFGVSRLHGEVSRQIFQPLFPRWPEEEVPFGHITNGVHMPSWDSAGADRLWTETCGRDAWRGALTHAVTRFETISDELLWNLRGESRNSLVGMVRGRLRTRLSERGEPLEVISVAETVLDPNALTLGFARRFTAYKRPGLLLHDVGRLERILEHAQWPVQLVCAGKAHPNDEDGKRIIAEWMRFAQEPRHRRHVVFLEDYDISLARELVQGVDVWINTPRRPWEACGTSGMKVLVNGGVNISTLDGWWEEAYAPELGWAIGGATAAGEEAQDCADAVALYELLEREVIPAFYNRDADGMPRDWIARMRRSMTELTPRYSATRMMQDYVEQAYMPAASVLRERIADGGARGKAMAAWARRLRRGWAGVHIGQPDFSAGPDGWIISAPVYLGDISPADVQVECYAAPRDAAKRVVTMTHDGPIPGGANAYIYRGELDGSRVPADHTVRVVPYFPGALVPAELSLIQWQR